MPEPRESLCYALDVSTTQEAEEQVERLAPHAGIFKVGLQLFVKGGPDLLAAIKKKGAQKIFLDLKVLDIPRTVRQARISAGSLPVDFLSVHSEGLLGMGAEPNGKEQTSLPGMLCVTILTSLGINEIRLLGYRRNLSVKDIVMLRTDIARDAGCAGVICSGMEVEDVRNRLGGTHHLIVTPGIRPSWAEVAGDDQTRTRTARETICAGANILVVGRPIRKAPDPVEAAQRILEEIDQGHKDRLGR